MEPQQSAPKKSPVGIIASVVVLLGVIGAIVFASNKKAPDTVVQDTTTPDTTTTPVVPATTPEPATPVVEPKKTTSVYKDGTYTATGSYMSPGGQDEIGVTLTLKGDVVTDVSATEMANDPRSKQYENMFIGGFKQYVVGKNIATLSLTKVSGSSLTPKGFNDALAKIKAQAKA
jgi:uncharacterized protein with FMN-binding domain